MRPNLIKPLLNPRNIRSIAYAPRNVEKPDFIRPIILRRFKLLLITAFQNGAIIYDQSSRLISEAPLALTEYEIMTIKSVHQNIERKNEYNNLSKHVILC